MLVVLLASLMSAQGAAPPAPAAPSVKEVEGLVAEYAGLDVKAEAGRARQDEILARLAGLPPLTAKEAAAWRKKLAKLTDKGAELEPKSGRHFLWPDDDGGRGLYIVGGDTRKPKGLFIGLHGGGVGEGDAESSRYAFEHAAGDLGWVAIFPEVLEKTEHGWTDSGTEEFVVELVERALRTWKIDRGQVFMGGHSMGGYGTWTLGARHADLFAGLTPSAGAPTPFLEGGKVVGIVDGVIPNLRNVRLAVYQSDDDPRVPPDANRKAVELLAQAREKWGGYDFDYWEEQGRGHDEPPGGMQALLARVQDEEREPVPDTVLWQPMVGWPRQFYWLYWERPLARVTVTASIQAEKGEVHVRCSSGGEGLYVLLDERLLPLERDVKVFFNDQEVFSGKPERSLAALLSTGARGDPELAFDVRIPLLR